MGSSGINVQPDGRTCAVATQFFHILFIPLFPIRSVVVVGYNPQQVCGVLHIRNIPLSARSIAWAWLRFFCLCLLWFYLPKASEERQNELKMMATGRVKGDATKATMKQAAREAEKGALLSPTSLGKGSEQHV